MKLASLLTLLLYLAVLFPAQAMLTHEPRVEAQRSTTLVTLQAHSGTSFHNKVFGDTPDTDKTLIPSASWQLPEFTAVLPGVQGQHQAGFAPCDAFSARAPPY